MTILLAPDKFRGSLTARQVCEAMSEGIGLANPAAHIVALPLADGGEGTAQCLTEATTGTWYTATVSDPLGRDVQAGFGISGDKTTAFIELAQASGLALLPILEHNHLIINTFGALGWRFLNAAGQQFAPTGETLIHIVQILRPETNALNADVGESVRIDIACDVANPLFGSNGAAFVYGPQKGATVLTGEGKLDAQTLQGKLVNGICRRAIIVGVPVVAICGTLELEPAQIQALGLTAAFSILNHPELLNEAVAGAYQAVVWATFNAIRLFYKTITH